MNKQLNKIVTNGVLVGVALALILPSTQPAVAGPLPDRPAVKSAKEIRASDLARTHWQSIAAGDVARVMEDYGPSPILHWDGGAFDGDYAGASAIQTVWSQFARLRAPLQVQVSDLDDKRGDNDTRIVTAYVIFSSHAWTYDVVYRLVFHQGVIVEETWRLAGPGDGPVINDPA